LRLESRKNNSATGQVHPLKKWLSLAVLITSLFSFHSQAQTVSPLKIGSKRFTESYVLGELVTQQANTRGSAIHLAGLGNTAIVLTALNSGAIDIYPEYTGTIAREILKDAKLVSLKDLEEPLSKIGLGVGVPLGFNNGYAIAVSEKTANRLKLSNLADLRNHPDLQLGLSSEFLQRPDGWSVIAQSYDLTKLSPHTMEHGLAYDALRNGVIDATDAYTTDARITHDHLILLHDNLNVLPPYSAVLLFRLEAPRLHPKEWQAILGLQNRITPTQMSKANARVDLEHHTPAESAKELLASIQNTPPQNNLGSLLSPNKSLTERSLKLIFSEEEANLILKHFILVMGPVVAASFVGIPLGIAGASFPAFGQVSLGIVGLLQTIPALALLALLIAMSGQIGNIPALITLFFYAMLPIVEATQSAFQGIDRNLRESAISLGSPWFQRTLYVELPVARPSILSGIRTAAIINVGGATLAAFVGAGGLGERIVGGLAVNDPALLIAGAVPSALMALVIQLLASALERYWHNQLR